MNVSKRSDQVNKSVPPAVVAPVAPPAAQTGAPSPTDNPSLPKFKFGRVFFPYFFYHQHRVTTTKSFPETFFNDLQDLGTVSGSLKAPEVTRNPGFEAAFYLCSPDLYYLFEQKTAPATDIN